ncbi:hypothetical protein CBR_g36585 [Chara braunii]|uniref:Protein kinase domain-containing protein n=1 Tax=Chara braunii TaxID=69332 RepID=A0A388JZ79_CHABU|nr:hypothetical protein CBR_g36585 [Chara braunii]|eukprot:GBG63098.1 hypothetical protein CBR_g36585 [Chara braunii]
MRAKNAGGGVAGRLSLPVQAVQQQQQHLSHQHHHLLHQHQSQQQQQQQQQQQSQLSQQVTLQTPLHRMIGDYIVTQQIGSGSFAVVWKGRHKLTSTEVAIKEIATDKLNRKLQDSLESEVAILKRANHPNIIHLLEIVKSHDRIFLVLEYCAGGDLSEYIKRHGRVPEATARNFMRQLAAGLRVLRDNNLIHRDLKPQNLLLSTADRKLTLKIADFGFARSLMPQGLAETLCGSPLYMAPEILQFQRYDAKADLWSVGAILFELVTGRPPFGGANHVQLLRNIERSEARIPENISSTLSEDCVDMCQRLLRRHPVERLAFEQFFHHPFLNLPRKDICQEGEKGGNTRRPAGVAEEKSTLSGAKDLSREEHPLRTDESNDDSSHGELPFVLEEDHRLAREQTGKGVAGLVELTGTGVPSSGAVVSQVGYSLRLGRGNHTGVILEPPRQGELGGGGGGRGPMSRVWPPLSPPRPKPTRDKGGDGDKAFGSQQQQQQQKCPEASYGGRSSLKVSSPPLYSGCMPPAGGAVPVGGGAVPITGEMSTALPCTCCHVIVTAAAAIADAQKFRQRFP